jgi:hypothetical protein
MLNFQVKHFVQNATLVKNVDVVRVENKIANGAMIWRIKMSTLLQFKIRRKSDNLFSDGGQFPTFSQDGKVWSRLNHLNCHLACVAEAISSYNNNARNRYKNTEITYPLRSWPYDDCEIVLQEYELVSETTFEQSLERYKAKL